MTAERHLQHQGFRQRQSDPLADCRRRAADRGIAIGTRSWSAISASARWTAASASWKTPCCCWPATSISSSKISASSRRTSIALYARRPGSTAPMHFKRRMSGPDMHVMLRGQDRARCPMSAASTYSMPTAELINSSAAWPVPDDQRRRPGLFQGLQIDPQSPDMLIEPVHSRITGAWATVLARKITGPNGEFLGDRHGASSRPISRSSSHPWRSATAPRFRCSIATARCWRAIPTSSDDRTEFQAGGPFVQDLSKSDHGTSRLTSPIDGQDRLAAARVLSQFPMSIIATTTVSAALADWREQIRFLIARRPACRCW